MTPTHLMVRLGCLASFLLVGSVAAAQPNPFDDYESSKPLVAAPKAPAAPAKPKDLRPNLDKGTLTLGGEGIFSFSTSTNELSTGVEQDNSTVFLRLAPSVGYFVIDNLEISLTPSLLVRRLDRGSDEPTAEVSWLVEASARYHHSITNRLSVHGGLGFGGYVGSSERTINANIGGEIRPVAEETDAAGISVSGVAGIGYLLTQELQLRAGLQGIWLVGNESTSDEQDLGVSTFHLGAGLGVYYFF